MSLVTSAFSGSRVSSGDVSAYCHTPNLHASTGRHGWGVVQDERDVYLFRSGVSSSSLGYPSPAPSGIAVPSPPLCSSSCLAPQQPLHPSVLSVSLFNRDIAGRLRVPARSVHCRHAECFDLQFFIRTNYLRHCSEASWKCPICEEYAFPHELYVDTLIQEILQVTDFHPPLKKAKTIAFATQDLTKYIITECLDEEDEQA